MYRINSNEQTEHDKVIWARAKQLRIFYSNVYANPGTEKNAHVNGLFPDIIVIGKNKVVRFIEEIETEDSVTEDQKYEQWVNYADIECTFNLIVPKAKLTKARQLIDDLDLNKLYYYRITKEGIKFKQVSKVNSFSRRGR